MPWNPARLQTLRQRAGLTQEQLAQKVGVHRVSIARFETGKLQPTIDVLETLAQVLRVRVDALLRQPRRRPKRR